jgi:hypothetical protein
MFNTLLIYFSNTLHIFCIIITYIFFLLPKKQFKKFGKWLLLFNIAIPLHWVYLNNQCILTIYSKKLGEFKDYQTTAPFSEKYMGPFYKPIMKLFDWKWNSKGLDKIVTLHWIINILLSWYYCFYY